MRKISFRSPIVRSSEPQESDYLEDQMAEKWANIGGGTASGVTVNTTTAMKFSAFWACVRILSELPASLQQQVIRIGKDGSRIEDRSHYLYKLIEQPNNLMDSFTFNEALNQDLQIEGNALSLTFHDHNGYPVERVYIPWKNVIEVKIYNRKLYYVIRYPELDIDGTYSAEDVTHYKILSANGFVGRGVLRHARETVGLGLTAERFGSKFFDKGGNIKAVIESDGEFKSDDEYKKWLGSFSKRFKGSKNDFEAILLERGMKYKAMGIAPNDAQFLETRTFQLTDISRFFLMPPHMIGELVKSSYSSMESGDIQFVKYTLRSLVKKQEKEIEWKLINPKERGIIHHKFNLNSLLRGDLKTRAMYYKTATGGRAWMSPDEVRGKENMNEVGGEASKVKDPANIMGKDSNQSSSTEEKK